jgi:hypothetical protein
MGKNIIISLVLTASFQVMAIDGRSLEPHTQDPTSTDIMGGGTPGHKSGGTANRRLTPQTQYEQEAPKHEERHDDERGRKKKKKRKAPTH